MLIFALDLPAGLEYGGLYLLGGLVCLALYGGGWLLWRRLTPRGSAYPWMDDPPPPETPYPEGPQSGYRKRSELD